MSMSSAVQAKQPITSVRRLNAKVRPACPLRTAYHSTYARQHLKPRRSVVVTVTQRHLDLSA
jgi:hypothetical protein